MKREWPQECYSEKELRRLEIQTAAAYSKRELSEEWQQEIRNLIREVRFLQAEYRELSEQLQGESLLRQEYAFNSRYWEEHYRILEAKRLRDDSS